MAGLSGRTSLISTEPGSEKLCEDGEKGHGVKGNRGSVPVVASGPWQPQPWGGLSMRLQLPVWMERREALKGLFTCSKVQRGQVPGGGPQEGPAGRPPRSLASCRGSSREAAQDHRCCGGRSHCAGGEGQEGRGRGCMSDTKTTGPPLAAVSRLNSPLPDTTHSLDSIREASNVARRKNEERRRKSRESGKQGA